MPAAVHRKLFPESVAYEGSGSGGGTGAGGGHLDIPVKPPANGNAPKREEEPRRIVVYDYNSVRLMEALLFQTGVRIFSVNSHDQFLETVREQNPHCAFVHLSNSSVILEMKADRSIASTPVVAMNSFGSWGENSLKHIGLLGPICSIPFNRDMLVAALETFGRGPSQPFPEPVPYVIDNLQRERRQHRESAPKILLWTRDDDFNRVYLERILEEFGNLTLDFTATIDPYVLYGRILALKPNLIVLVDAGGAILRGVGQMMTAAGISVFGFTPAESTVSRAEFGADRPIEIRSLPLAKFEIVEIAQKLLSRSLRWPTHGS